MNAYMNQYQNTHIQTASPEKILIMLYDGAIRFCREAMQAMDTGNTEVQNEKITRVMAIVGEFAVSLDHDIGGDIARDLDALYMFMIRELTRANVEKDNKALETVHELLSGLRDTWVEAADIYAKEKQVSMVSFGSSMAVAM